MQKGIVKFYYQFQFTHPGGVRQGVVTQVSDLTCVSIHAPGRGATYTKLSDDRVKRKFQFTHPGGVRPRRSIPIVGAWEFQFTHPGGVRPKLNASSITLQCFNSRTREGCDRSPPLRPPGASRFQFTHPGGVRRRRLRLFIL